jgi:hypothetical protein
MEEAQRKITDYYKKHKNYFLLPQDPSSSSIASG